MPECPRAFIDSWDPFVTYVPCIEFKSFLIPMLILFAWFANIDFVLPKGLSLLLPIVPNKFLSIPLIDGLWGLDLFLVDKELS